MSQFEKRKRTMIENIMRDEKVSAEQAERIFHERLSQAGRKGGKSPKTAPSGFAAMTPEERAEAGSKGGKNRWKNAKEAKK